MNKFKHYGQKVVADNKLKATVRSLTEKQERTCFEKLKFYYKKKVINFCGATSLHGYSHLISKQHSFFEKILWFLVTMTASVFAIGLLRISWKWNSKLQTITIIETVTICALNKISSAKALTVASQMQKPANMTDEELANMLRYLFHFKSNGNATDEDYRKFNDILTINQENINNLYDKLHIRCDEMLKRCSWKGALVRCDSLFERVNTSMGICCSFNYYASKSDTYDEHIANGIPKQPRRITSSGFVSGLSVLLDDNPNNYHTTEIGSSGFRIIVHNSFNYPVSNSVNKFVKSESEALMEVIPEEFYSTDAVLKLPVEDRNCLSFSERIMSDAVHYSFDNCMEECRADIAFEQCGCVPYFLPNNETRKTCKPSKIRCLKNNLSIFSGSIFGVHSKNVSKLEESQQYMTQKCNCLPNCQDYVYSVDSSSAFLNRQYTQSSLNFFKDVELENKTLVHIYFNDLVATRYRKDVYTNWLGLLAAFGGLLGLFLGFSMITGLEFVYFFTLRVFFDQLV